jgi:DNA helicase II / ATP-dependent DNA helicase PcrA
VRLPNEAQLSREQKEVCFAPTAGTILVTGPPGSGKTVVAIFRQNALRKKKQSVQTLVYSKVLSRYTDINSTFYAWLSKWWKGATGKNFPSVGSGRDRRYDFLAAVALATGEAQSALSTKGNWGHLILDEAQDYSPNAHKFLHIVAVASFADRPKNEQPSITILADENQRLHGENSDLKNILDAHYLRPEDDVYELRRNYRNTKEIAAFAAKFYTGLPTGVPEPPTERGDPPRLVVTHSLDDAIRRIVLFAKTRPKEDHGVLVYYEQTRSKVFNKLAHQLKGANLTVQTYTSQWNHEHNDASKLRFDGGGSVTVLCFASAKGLEFDAVFLPEIQTVPMHEDNVLNTKMNLYVMTSRARKNLFLFISDATRGSPIWEILPTDASVVEIEDLTRESGSR